MPFFSIVIPLYNKQKFISNTLKSLLNQTFDDFEILIVNDGSTDGSAAIVQAFNDKRIHYSYQENQGVSATRNFGMSRAKADYICFLDADDFWYSDFLETMHRNILKFPNQFVFASAIEIETSKSIFKPDYSVAKTGDHELVDYFEASMKESVIWTGATVFHKSVFEKSGNFDPNIRSGEDIDLWIRIGLLYPVLFSWKIVARYVYDAESLSKDKLYAGNTINFSKFEALEKAHPKLKKYLDLNRFSIAIKSKLAGKNESFRKYKQEINMKNLSFKKRFLLQLPTVILLILIRLKTLKANLGLGNSVFK